MPELQGLALPTPGEVPWLNGSGWDIGFELGGCCLAPALSPLPDSTEALS